MSKKNLVGTVIEGGRGGSSKSDRRYRNRIIRRRSRVPIYATHSPDDYTDEEYLRMPTERAQVSNGGYREFRDKLAPLRRWLERQVGRLWDDVWSDVCHRADAHSVRGNHFRDHVRSYVLRRGYDYSLSRYGVTEGLYVDRSGILRKRSRRELDVILEPFRRLDDRVHEASRRLDAAHLRWNWFPEPDPILHPKAWARWRRGQAEVASLRNERDALSRRVRYRQYQMRQENLTKYD